MLQSTKCVGTEKKSVALYFLRDGEAEKEIVGLQVKRNDAAETSGLNKNTMTGVCAHNAKS